MEESNESYAKFKIFLESYFIRKANGEYNADDFKKDNYEHIQPHLQKLLPQLTLIEAFRIKSYFHSAFRFNLNIALKRPNIPPERSITSVAIDGDEEGNESAQRNRIEAQPDTVNVSEISSQPFAQEETPLESVDKIQSRRTFPLLQSTTPENTLEYVVKGQSRQTLPLMQSTPLTVVREAGMNPEQRRLETLEEDHFFDDIISQLNISNIPGPSAPKEKRVQFQPRAVSPANVENSVPFLDKFANFQRQATSPEQTSTPNIRRRARKRRTIEPILREPKKKMTRMKFDVLCRLTFKKKTDSQVKQSEESYLYFPLMPGKRRNMIQRIMNNIVIQEGERGHISMQRVQNLSNVLRAHSSQRQTSVEQPVQISQISSIRSPCTPQALLRTSSLLPFNPLQGDVSGQAPRMEIDQATRSLLHQQPLLPIPEIESSIHISTGPRVEAIHLNTSTINIPPLPECVSEIPSNIHEDLATSSNIPRAVSENVENIGEQLLGIVHNEPSPTGTQQQEVQINSSQINIQPLTEHEPPCHLEITDDQQHSNLPQMVSEDFEISRQRPQVDSIVQQGLPICYENPTETNADPGLDLSIALPALVGELRLLSQRVGLNNIEELVPVQLNEVIVQADVPHINHREDNTRTNWYEILRSRAGLAEYPQEERTRWRNRKRRRRRNNSEERVVRPRLANELPDIPPSPPRENQNSVQIPQLQESINVEHLNVQPQVGVSNIISDQMPQNQESINLGTSNVQIHDIVLPLTPPAHLTSTIDGILDQATQHPVSENEKSLKSRYLELLKEAGRKIDYDNWDHFDSGLFNENDNFELYTHIFKRIIEDNYVHMDTLYERGTSRLEAAKGFRLILELKIMGLIEIESIATQILGFRLKPANNIRES